ncbi:hypothetical protein ACH5RR_029396, partial [Cinchona calisaya]
HEAETLTECDTLPWELWNILDNREGLRWAQLSCHQTYLFSLNSLVNDLSSLRSDNDQHDTAERRRKHGFIDEPDDDYHGDDGPSRFTMMTPSHTVHAFSSGSTYDDGARPSHVAGPSSKTKTSHGSEPLHGVGSCQSD